MHPKEDYGAREVYYDPGVRILIMMRRALQAWDYDDLASPFWRLYWNSKRGAAILHGTQRVPLNPDRLVLVSPDTPINLRLTHPPVTHFYTHFITQAPFSRVPPRIYTFPIEPGMLGLISRLPANDNDRLTDRFNTIMAVRGLIYRLLSRISSEDLRPLRLAPRLRESMSFLDAHIQHSTSNAELARRMGVSVRTMLRQYEDELGMTPMDYLRQKRLEEACVLLHDPQMSIEQIAERTGFYDRYHFTKVFAANMGQSPGRFRDYHTDVSAQCGENPRQGRDPRTRE